MKKNGLKTAIWYVLLIGAVIVSISFLYKGSGNNAKLQYSDVVSYFENDDNLYLVYINDENGVKIKL